MQSRYLLRHCSLVTIIFLSFLNGASANPAPVPALPGWLNSTLPTKGDGFEGEIKCYGLPYGGIGFTSHVLTYYTLFMLSIDRSPWTWSKSKHWKFDLTLALLSLAGTTITSILTMVRCRNRWQFVCVAVWKLSMSVTLSAISTAAALRIRRRSGGKDQEVSRKDSLYWLILYIPGLAIGFTGLLSVILQSWSNNWLQIITIHFLSMGSAFAAVLVFIVIGFSLERIRKLREGYIPLPAALATTPLHVESESLLAANTYKSPQGASLPLLSHDRAVLVASESMARSENDPAIPMITITRDSLDISASTPLSPNATTNRQAFQGLFKTSGLSDMGSPNEQDNPSRWKRMSRRLGGRLEKINVPELAALRDAALGNDAPLRRLLLILGILTSPVLITLGIFGALYSDFALGSIASNMVGVPSGDNAWLFWGYFAFKRLPMLSA